MPLGAMWHALRGWAQGRGDGQEGGSPMSLSRVSTLTSCSEEDDASAKKKPLLLGEVQQDSSSLERRDELEAQALAGLDPNLFVVAPNGDIISLSGGNASSLISTAPGAGIPQRGGRIFNRDDFLPMRGEPISSYLTRVMFEGHTFLDAILVIVVQMGQGLLTAPYALFEAGILGGGIIWVWAYLVNFWTVWNYLCLYLELKRDKIKSGEWWDASGKHSGYVLQWLDLAGYHLGQWAWWMCWGITVLSLTGACVAQPIAAASSMYEVDPLRSKREWQIIYGASMVLLGSFIPKFTKFRLLSIFGIAAGYTAVVFAITQAWSAGFAAPGQIQVYPVSGKQRPGSTMAVSFFNGAAMILSGASTTGLVVESLESMEQPAHYKLAYPIGVVAYAFNTVAHSWALNLSKLAPGLLYAANMYTLFSLGSAKLVSVYLMIGHTYVSYMLWSTQYCIAIEKALGVHTQPYLVKVAVRIPINAAFLMLSLLVPFYGTINALMASIGGTVVGYSVLSLAMIKVYWTKERRQKCVAPPFRWLQWREWTPVFIIHGFVCVFFLVFSVFSLYYAILALTQDYATWAFSRECFENLAKGPWWGVYRVWRCMPECYDCPPNWRDLLHHR